MNIDPIVEHLLSQKDIPEDQLEAYREEILSRLTMRDLITYLFSLGGAPQDYIDSYITIFGQVFSMAGSSIDTLAAPLEPTLKEDEELIDRYQTAYLNFNNALLELIAVIREMKV